MTLCVTYVTNSGVGVSLTDSLLTTTRKVPDSGGFLPSNEEIVHQTPYAVKFHNITGVKAYGGNSIDILVAIAGNVSLGLQCALHIDSYLKYGYTLWFNDIKNIIQEKVYDFWSNTRDKQIQMSFALFDHKMRPQLLECRARGRREIKFEVVSPNEGFSLSVLGDDWDEARKKILSKITSLLYVYDLETAIRIASVSVLQDCIDDPTKIFIGGHIQGGCLDGYSGQYLIADYGRKYFRGTMLSDYDSIELPILSMKDPLFKIDRNADYL